MKAKILLAMGLMGLNGSVWAQGCPAGIPSAGNPACIPPDRENSPYYQGHGGSNRPAAPRMIWADRWGAIATDGASASVGTVVSLSSKGKAEKAAMAQCRAKGGGGCKVIFAYYNQCAVVVTGNNQHLAQGAATIDEASRLGIEKCKALDTNCNVYYAECSMAERIQ